jgi:hypothetical protein
MKKMSVISLLSLSVLSFSAFSSVKTFEDATKKQFEISVDGLKLDYKIIEGQTFQVANLVGVDGFTGVRHEVGAPEIPVVRFYVLAENKDSININVSEEKGIDFTYLQADYKPAMESVEKIPGRSYKIVKNKSYNTFMNYPGLNYEITEAGSIRGQKQFLVTLYPVDFNGLSNSLRIARDFKVEVKKSLQKQVDEASEAIVFIVGNQFKNSPSLLKYMELKASLGFQVLKLDVTNGMTPDQIRSKLQSLLKQNPALKYGLVIGDDSDVPAHESTIIEGITDHYYAAIDTNDYSSDLNGPDLGVGRISVENEGQLAKVLAKYTRYVKGDFTSVNWLNNLSFLATDDRYIVAEGSHNYVIDNYTKKLGYRGIFPSANENGGDKLYAITYKAGNAEVMKSLTKGRSIVDYSGHGANTFWDAPRVDQDDVRSLDATSSSLPFVISNACITGDFRVDESFAETWQRHEYGAVMFWGSMDSTYWDEDDILEKRMFDGIFKNGNSTFAKITDFALAEVWKYYGGQERSQYYRETYHMFGDPSVNLRLK